MNVMPVVEVPRLPPRRTGGHKGTYGTVLVVAGSPGMSGAAVLVGRGALHAGAGLVRIACPASIQDVVAASYPCYTTFGIRQDADGTLGDGAAEEVAERAKSADVVALGPGLGQDESVTRFVRSLLQGIPDIPVVLDADGLNAIAPFDAGMIRPAGPLVMTPHPGEFARLIGKSVHEVQAQRDWLANDFARRAGVVLLLKGTGTLVTDSQKLYRNTTGNPGMATGGSGDVLTGVIAALLAQGLQAFDAAVLGAWVHGRAGDLAAMKLGQIGMTSVDIADNLAHAFRDCESA